MSKTAFIEVISMLPPRLRDALDKVSCEVRQSATEIRLRAELPITIVSGKRLFFLSDEHETPRHSERCQVVSQRELAETVSRLCEYSVYAREEEIMNGYITVRGGHRVGLCGTYFKDKCVERISSLNIRIASACAGCSEKLTVRLPLLKPQSLLIAGPPASGKTTLLRDLVRVMSSSPRYFRTAVIDERGEIAAVYRGRRGMDLGLTCDVLDGYPRKRGFEISVRSLSPQIAVCDEIGKESDCEAIEFAALSGVKVFATAHADGIDDLLRNGCTKSLIKSRLFEYVCLLSGKGAPGEIADIIRTSDISCG